MEGGVRGVDEKVIHVDDEPSFSDHITKGVIHKLLEGSGELVSPKNITVGSNNPLWMTKAAFHWWPSLIHMLLYPQ